MKHNKHAQGFTLIELMIVVAIVSILSAIAYPSYRQYVIKGRRAEGRAALIGVLQAQERYFTQYGKYYTGSADGPNPFKAYSGDNEATSAYSIASAPCADDLTATECVQITAHPIRNDDPDVGDLIITSVGPTRSCSGPKTGQCWK